MANQVKDLYSNETPISDLTLEKQMISALIVSNDTINKYGVYLNAGTFTDPDLAEIYKAIVSINDRGEEVSPITVIDELRSNGSKLDEVAVINFAITDMWVEHAEHIAKRLQALYKRRTLFNLARRITMLTSEEAEPIEHIHTMMAEYLEETGLNTELVDLGVACKDVLKQIDDNREGGHQMGTITGFSRLDAVGGFHEGDLIVVAGDTSSGKTSFALSIALNAIFANEKIAFYSLEMTYVELAARILAIRSRISSSTILYKKLWPDELHRINQAVGMLPKENMLFDDIATNSFDNIISSIRSLHHTKGIRGAIVDYIQILNINNKTKDTQEQLMAVVARRLKNLARELGIWIVALSQINRDSQSPQPTLSRLRNSGQIAEAADVVLLVYRPEIYGRTYAEKEFTEMPTHNTALIDIAKGRNIGTGKFICRFEPIFTHFYDDKIEPIKKEEIKEVSETESKKNVAMDEQELPF